MIRTLLLSFLTLCTFTAAQAQYAITANTANDPTVTFSILGSPCGTNGQVTWTLDNGICAYGDPFTFTFQTNGVHLICATVTDTTIGCTVTWCDSVVVWNAPGGGGCTAAYTYARSGLTVTLMDNSSTAAGVVFNSWDLGDGSAIIGQGQNVTHTYAAAGTYTVCDTMTAADGCMDVYCQTITVPAPPACQAGFYSYPDTTLPNTTWIVDISTGSSPNLPLNYLWDFGDGTTSTLQTPSHTYANSGAYWVCVSIADGAGCSSTFCDSVYAIQKTNAAWTVNVISSVLLAQAQPAAAALTLSPNPAHDRVTVEINLPGSRSARLDLLNALGQTVMSRKQPLNGSTQAELNLADLPAGIYYVRFTDETSGRAVQKKLIVY